MGGQNPQNYSADKSLEASKYSVDKNLQNEALNRIFQQALNTSQQQFTGSQNELNRAQQEALQRLVGEQGLAQLASQQSFQGGESEKERTFGKEQQQTAFEQAMQQLASQQAFAGGETEKQRAFEQGNIDYNRQQTEQARQAGEQQQQQAESAFLGDVNQSSPFLDALKNSITQNALPEQQRARNEMATNIRQHGVRGGQASTLLNRGTGEFNNGLNQQLSQLQYSDELARRQAKQQFLGNKAQTAQNRALSTV